MINNPNLLTISSIFELIGSILIAFVILGVHSRIIEEHKIDEVVLKTMRREKVFVYVGVFFLVLSFILELCARNLYGIFL